MKHLVNSKLSEKQKKETILLKVSGASLKSNDDSSVISLKKIESMVLQIAKILKKYNVAIVIGGGNIWRGQTGKNFQFDSEHSDYIGMLATVMNANFLHAACMKHGIPSMVFSALRVETISNPMDFGVISNVIKKSVCIFAGGIGEPHFTTDTVAVLRAIQIKAKKLLIGKNGVDGVYSSDPNKKGKPIFFEKLSYDHAVYKSLKIMDKTAFSLASEHDLEMIIFNIDGKDSVLNALKSNTIKTIISRKG